MGYLWVPVNSCDRNMGVKKQTNKKYICVCIYIYFYGVKKLPYSLMSLLALFDKNCCDLKREQHTP